MFFGPVLLKLCGGSKSGDYCHLGNGDVTETFQFAVRSRVLGPDVLKDMFLQEFNVFTEGMVFDSILLVWFFAFCFSCKFCHRGLTTIRNGPQQD